MSAQGREDVLKQVAPEDQAQVKRMLDKLDLYAENGRELLGDFLAALVRGDLQEATARADGTNIKYLRQYVQYMYSRLRATYVFLGQPALRAIRDVVAETGPVSAGMVEEALGNFKFRLRQLARG